MILEREHIGVWIKVGRDDKYGKWDVQLWDLSAALFHTPRPQPHEKSYLSAVGSRDVPSSCWESCRLGKITGHILQALLIWAVSALCGTRPTAGWKWQVLGQLKPCFQVLHVVRTHINTHTCAHTHTHNQLGNVKQLQIYFLIWTKAWSAA